MSLALAALDAVSGKRDRAPMEADKWRLARPRDDRGGGMKVLVAGDRGYIGAVLVPFLRTAGHTVDGLDLGLYEGCDLGPAPEDVSSRPRIDLRNVEPRHCIGYDAVICLAALSNDPVGHLNPAATYSINLDGTVPSWSGRQEGGRRAISVCILLQSVRVSGLRGGSRGRCSFPRHTLW